MKKITRKIRDNMFIFILGGIVCSAIVVLAGTITSSMVEYDTSNSRSPYDTVQTAIDDLYTKVPSSAGLSLVANSVPGLSNQLLAELYRYQGKTADNYICFGTRDPVTCKGDTDKYMYRIIGITADGKMKLIKKEALNTAYAWDPSNSTWPNSTLYLGLNGSYFLTNTTYVPSGWEDRIARMPWHYWSGSGDNTQVNVTLAEMASKELGAASVNAKIGLKYIHDLYYSTKGSGTPSTQENRESWMNLWNAQNDSNLPTTYLEWTMSRWNWYSNIWTIQYDGTLRADSQTTENFVRPVFYLNSYQVIGSGTGTLSDPYILDREYNITNTNNQIAVRNIAPAGTTIQLTGNNLGGTIGSFKVNGRIVYGNTFIMPTEDVEITDVRIYHITNNSNNDNVTIVNSAVPGSTITIDVTLTYVVSSFKMNGTTINGNSFTMPEDDVEITDVVLFSYFEANYTQVDYLKFTGTQYINTGIVPSNHTTEIKFDFETFHNNYHLIGTSSNSNYYFFTEYSNSYAWGRNGTYTTAGTWTAGIHVLVFNGDNYSVVLDGVTLGSGVQINSPNTLYIGYRGGGGYPLIGKVYYVKITDKSTGNLVRHLIPAVRKSDSVAGFYDLANNVFYTNAGSGTFTVPS